MEQDIYLEQEVAVPVEMKMKRVAMHLLWPWLLGRLIS